MAAVRFVHSVSVSSASFRPHSARLLGSQFSRFVGTAENPFAAPAAPPVNPFSSPAAPVKVASKQTTLKEKKARDPDRPARPLSPWLRFVADFRKANPELKSVALKSAGSKWKVLTPEQKRPFEAPYEDELKTYRSIFEKYVSSGKKDAWSRDPDKPKKPQTAFFQFLGEFRKANGSLKITEASKQGSVAWKALRVEQKAPYEQVYAVEKEQYAKDLEKYKASGKEDAWKKKVGVSSDTSNKKTKKVEKKTKEVKQKTKEVEKPTRPPSAYQRFAKEFRQSNADLKGVQATEQAKAAWTQLSAEQKGPYEQAHTTDKAKYDKDMKRYNKKAAKK